MDKKPKILIAASIYPPDSGGPAIHAKAQYEGFPKFGVKTGLVALAEYRRWPKGIRHVAFLFALLRQVYEYDLVLAHDQVGAGIPALMAARLFGKKIMVRIGGDIAWEREAESGKTNLSLKEWYEAGEAKCSRLFKLSHWFLRRVDAIVVTSPLLRDLYISAYGVDGRKITVIPNPTPEVSANNVETEQTIIFASRLVAYKNLETVLYALAPVFADFPEVKFLIMGDGPQRQMLQNLSQKLKIERNVIFRGAIPQGEVLSATSKCLFALAPALTEFNPNYILQAIAFDKPFLISREHGLVNDIPEELQFNARDASELEARIRWMLDPTNYRIAQEKIAHISYRQTWNDVLTANLKVASELLNG